MEDDFREAIGREQLRLAMRQVPTMQAASVVVALVLSYAVRGIVPRGNILLFLLLVSAVSAGRVILCRRFLAASQEAVRRGELERRLPSAGALLGHRMGKLRLPDPPARECVAPRPFPSRHDEPVGVDDRLPFIDQVGSRGMDRSRPAALCRSLHPGRRRVWSPSLLSHRSLPGRHASILAQAPWDHLLLHRIAVREPETPRGVPPERRAAGRGAEDRASRILPAGCPHRVVDKLEDPRRRFRHRERLPEGHRRVVPSRPPGRAPVDARVLP